MKRWKDVLAVVATVGLIVGTWFTSRAVFGVDDPPRIRLDGQNDPEQRPPVAVPETSDAHLAFLDATLRDGVSLRGAVIGYLAERGAERSLYLHGWRVDTSEEEHRYTLHVGSEVDGDFRQMRFDHDPSSGAIEPASELAKAVDERAGEPVAKNYADVFPKSYSEKPADVDGSHWEGRPRRICKHPLFKENCDTMVKFFERRDLVRSLGWVFGTMARDAESFSVLRDNSSCKWRILSRLPNVVEKWASHRVIYECASARVRWNFDTETRRTSALSDAARLVAAIHTFHTGDTDAPPAEVDLVERQHDVQKVINKANDEGEEEENTAPESDAE